MVLEIEFDYLVWKISYFCSLSAKFFTCCLYLSVVTLIFVLYNVSHRSIGLDNRGAACKGGTHIFCVDGYVRRCKQWHCVWDAARWAGLFLQGERRKR